jgi:glycosyltransferase involved in cell wall biosynthesis
MKDRSKIHICHFTSVHPNDDIRIFRKECVSLAKAGYKVTLVAPGTINEMRNGVRIISVGDFPKNRLKRMYFFSKKVIERAKIVDADVYHFHDPELLQGAWELIRQGKKVIYDAHEDVPKQILGKYWIKPFLRIPISYAYKFYEDLVASKLSGVLSATPFINERYLRVNTSSININNFPFLSEFENNSNTNNKENYVCYVGGITIIRGALEMVRAMEHTNGIKLILAGNFSPLSLQMELEKEKGWDKVEYVGNAKREEVAKIFAKSKAGLVVMHPLPNHIDAQPNKMFEYMSASLPVIGSNFELWKEVIECHTSNCGK